MNKFKILLFAFVIFGVFGTQIKQASANIYVADLIGRYLTSYELNMVPGAYERRQVLLNNNKKIDGILVIKFEESRNYFGFSAMICDEENMLLYEASKKASCFRKKIDSKKDIIKYKFDGTKKYYLLVINRTRPLNVARDITVIPHAYTKLNEIVRTELKAQIQSFEDKLNMFFVIEPLNFAVIPCEKKYIASILDKRAITICSELILGENMVPNNDLLIGAISYELAPFLDMLWNTKQIQSEISRLQLSAMTIMLFSDTIQTYKNNLDFYQNTPSIQLITKQYSNASEDFSYTDRLNSMIDIFNDSYTMIDPWLQVAYEDMKSEILGKIRDDAFRHYAYLRNTARLVLKRRLEKKLKKEKLTGDGEKNIISDLW